MLETIAIVLIVLWLLGMVSGYTMGNFIYVLLVIAVVLFLVRLVSGRESYSLALSSPVQDPSEHHRPASAMRGLSGSSSTIVPRRTAITGFTYAYSDTVETGRCLSAYAYDE